MLRLTEVVKNLLIINVFNVFGGLCFQYRCAGPALSRLGQISTFSVGDPFFYARRPDAPAVQYVGLGHVWGGAGAAVGAEEVFVLLSLLCVWAALLHIAVDYCEISQLERIMADFATDPSYGSFQQFFDKVNLGGINVGAREAIEEMGAMLSEGNTSIVANAQDYMGQYIEMKKGIPVVGASGAIYGLLLGFGCCFLSMS